MQIEPYILNRRTAHHLMMDAAYPVVMNADLGDTVRVWLQCTPHGWEESKSPIPRHRTRCGHDPIRHVGHSVKHPVH